jgi:hypothetical protein
MLVVCERVTTLSYTPMWGVIAVLIGLILILAHFAIRQGASTGDAFTLGTSSLGAVAGLQLIAVSLATLGCKKPAGPFGADDLGFIAISAGILTLVSYRAIAAAFRNPGQ